MTSHNVDEKPKCAGCNITLPLPVSRHSNAVELFPGTFATLCDGRERVCRQVDGTDYIHGTANVSATCLRKAREKLSLCPGCGAKGHVPGTLCHECHEAIARSKELVEARGDLRWYALNLSEFIPYLSDMHDDPEKLRDRFGRLLMRACAAGRYSDRLPETGTYNWIGDRAGGRWIGCPAAEMTREQADAFAELIGLLRPLFALYESHGEERGRSVLQQLIAGKLSTSDLDEGTARAVEQRAEMLEKLSGSKHGKKR